jgi:hypothetical protein
MGTPRLSIRLNSEDRARIARLAALWRGGAGEVFPSEVIREALRRVDEQEASNAGKPGLRKKSPRGG